MNNIIGTHGQQLKSTANHAEIMQVQAKFLEGFGEGEWKVRQHGVSQRRTWRKIHLAVDEAAKDILGIEVTTADWNDSEVLADLLG